MVSPKPNLSAGEPVPLAMNDPEIVFQGNAPPGDERERPD
jgi:hypothetical protein